MNLPLLSLLFQRLPYVLILCLFFCLVPWKNMEFFSFNFWIVLCMTGLLLFQIIKNNKFIWGLIVFLFSFFAIWMVLAFLSDINKAESLPTEFVFVGGVFLVGLFLLDLWLIRCSPEKEEIRRVGSGSIF